MACTPHNFLPSPTNNLWVNQTVFVDAQFGNDGSGVREDMTKPYLTLIAAQAAALPGDIIHVRIGTYVSPTITMVDEIDWYFEEEAQVNTTFTDGGNSVAVEIFGKGVFTTSSYFVRLTGPNSIVRVHGDSLITTGVFPAFDSSSNRGGYLEFETIECRAGICVYLHGFSTKFIIKALSFVGYSTLILMEQNLTGGVVVDINRILIGTGGLGVAAAIVSRANAAYLFFTSEIVNSQSSYFMQISDGSANPTNSSVYSINVNALNCVGIVSAVGIAGQTNPNLQPKIYLDSQIVRSNLTSPVFSPVVSVSHAIFSFKYNTWEYRSAFAFPASHIIDIGDITLIDFGGLQTLNVGTTELGLLSVSAATSACVQLDSSEITNIGQLLLATGPTEITIIGNTLDITTTTPVALLDAAGDIIYDITNNNINAATFAGLYINRNDMHFVSQNVLITSPDSIFFLSPGILHVQIGHIESDSDNATYFQCTNNSADLDISYLRMGGTGCLAMTTSCPLYMRIGQIFSFALGSRGIFVNSLGQIFGQIDRIELADGIPYDSISQFRSEFTFVLFSAQTALALIRHTGTGEIDTTGNILDAHNCEHGVYLDSPGASLDLTLNELEGDVIGTALLYVSGDTTTKMVLSCNNCYTVVSTGLAGIYLVSGNTKLVGIYDFAGGTPAISVNGDAVLDTNVQTMGADGSILVANTSGNVWYAANRSITRGATDAFILTEVDPNQEFTISGYVATAGDYAINCVSIITKLRVLNGILVSAVESIFAPLPTTFVCNGCVGNQALNVNVSAIPAGFYTQDAGIF
jgi:hypothetical protein